MRTTAFLLVLMILFLSFSSVGGVDSQSCYIVMESPKYSIESRDVEMKIWIVNNGSHSFNGTLNVRVLQDRRYWPLTKYNVTNLDGNSSKLFIFKFYPSMGSGVYFVEGKLYDDMNNYLKEYSYPVTVKSYGETATIGAAVFAFISLIIISISRR